MRAAEQDDEEEEEETNQVGKQKLRPGIDLIKFVPSLLCNF
jgi:hypothetical protein